MPQIHVNCALCDKFLKIGMMLGMGIRFSKTTANKVGHPRGCQYAQHSQWLPLEIANIIFHLLLAQYFQLILTSYCTVLDFIHECLFCFYFDEALEIGPTISFRHLSWEPLGSPID